MAISPSKRGCLGPLLAGTIILNRAADCYSTVRVRAHVRVRVRGHIYTLIIFAAAASVELLRVRYMIGSIDTMIYPPPTHPCFPIAFLQSPSLPLSLFSSPFLLSPFTHPSPSFSSPSPSLSFSSPSPSPSIAAMGWMPDKSVNPSTIYANHLMSNNSSDPSCQGMGKYTQDTHRAQRTSTPVTKQIILTLATTLNL